ncbi:unnamed protein product [Trichogramma brassicae]|uniref:Uncharacterized protein n=1 Tax=Trichogramma brassicae TaxID=86971 RepID=A0A6H5I5D7_9HYME|nr:unnamed protein product [Trichogramma brassicae]
MFISISLNFQRTQLIQQLSTHQDNARATSRAQVTATTTTTTTTASQSRSNASQASGIKLQRTSSFRHQASTHIELQASSFNAHRASGIELQRASSFNAHLASAIELQSTSSINHRAPIRSQLQYSSFTTSPAPRYRHSLLYYVHLCIVHRLSCVSNVSPSTNPARDTRPSYGDQTVLLNSRLIFLLRSLMDLLAPLIWRIVLFDNSPTIIKTLIRSPLVYYKRNSMSMTAFREITH